MLTPEQIKEIRSKAGLPTSKNYPGKYDYLRVKQEVEPEKGNAITKAFQNIKTKIGNRGKELNEDIDKASTEGLANNIVGSNARLLLRGTGAVAGSIGDIFFEGLKVIAPDKVEDAIKEKVTQVGAKVAKTDVAQRFMSWAEKNPESAKDLENILDISSFIPAGKAASVGVKTASNTIKASAKVAGKVAEGSKPLLGKSLSAVGTIGEKAGKTLVSASIPPTEQAARILSYKAKTPLLKRFEKAMVGKEKAPITPADVLIKYNLQDVARSGIGIKSKRLANELFENQLKPVLKGIKEKVSKNEIFSEVEKQIKKTNDLSQRKALSNALEAMKDDYKYVSSWSVYSLDKLKSNMAKRLPSKVYNGQEIAGDMANLRKMFSDVARSKVRKTLDNKMLEIYDDYGALKDLMKLGERALKSGLNTNLIGLTGEAFRMATTPLTTIGGSTLSKVGTAIRKTGNKLLSSKTKLRK